MKSLLSKECFGKIKLDKACSGGLKSSNQAFATKISADLKRILDDVCKKLGLRKNFVVESALREKLEDLIDAHDLQESIREATGFIPWKKLRQQLKKKGSL